jgi:hypothetical protein
VLAGAALFPVATGCYTYRAIPGEAAAAGTPVSLDITDRGRVGLASDVGPGVRRIEGTLVGRTDSLLVVSVREVDLLNGRSTRWSGETVRVPRDWVASVGERNFSRGRTWLAIGAATALTAAAIIAVTLIVDGNPDGGSTRLPPGPEPQ